MVARQIKSQPGRSERHHPNGNAISVNERTCAMTNHAIPHSAVTGHSTSHGLLASLYRNWNARRQVRRLQDKENHILDDIGVTRDELDWASQLPLTANAAIELHQVSYRRRKEQQFMWL